MITLTTSAARIIHMILGQAGRSSEGGPTESHEQNISPPDWQVVDGGSSLAARNAALQAMLHWLTTREGVAHWELESHANVRDPIYIYVPCTDDDRAIELGERAAELSVDLLERSSWYVVVVPVVGTER